MWIVTVGVDPSKYRPKDGDDRTIVEQRHFLLAGEHSVGRKFTTLKIAVIGDGGVSKNQGTIRIAADYNVQDLQAHQTLHWTNSGKFSSYIDGKKSPSHVPVEIQSGQTVAFGKHSVLQFTKTQPRMVVCSSRLSASSGLAQVLKNCAQLGAAFQSTWTDKCTHLVVPPGQLGATNTVLCALMACAPIVAPSWLQAVVELVQTESPLAGSTAMLKFPPPQDFAPEAKSSWRGRLTRSSMEPDERRKTLFLDLTFGFLTKNHPSTRPVTLGKGRCVVWPGAKEDELPSTADIKKAWKAWQKEGVDYIVASDKKQQMMLQKMLTPQAKRAKSKRSPVIASAETIAFAVLNVDTDSLAKGSSAESRNAAKSSAKSKQVADRNVQEPIASGWTSVVPNVSLEVEDEETDMADDASVHSSTTSVSTSAASRPRQMSRSMQRRHRAQAVRTQNEKKTAVDVSADNQEQDEQQSEPVTEIVQPGKWYSVAGETDSDGSDNDIELDRREIPSAQSTSPPQGKRFFRKNRVPPAPTAYVRSVQGSGDADSAADEASDSANEEVAVLNEASSEVVANTSRMANRRRARMTSKRRFSARSNARARQRALADSDQDETESSGDDISDSDDGAGHRNTRSRSTRSRRPPQKQARRRR